MNHLYMEIICGERKIGKMNIRENSKFEFVERKKMSTSENSRQYVRVKNFLLKIKFTHRVGIFHLENEFFLFHFSLCSITII